MNELSILLTTALWLGFFHTIVGVDHYIPFTALSRTRNWSDLKTHGFVTLCGVAHVLSSVLLGLVGIALGTGVTHLVGIEELRGEWAAWLLMAFGVGYTIWGVFRLLTGQKGHGHFHGLRFHRHEQHGEHEHEEKPSAPPKQTRMVGSAGWMMMIIFVLGPCEPLIPLLMMPAASQSGGALALVTLCFAAVTVLTMNAAVFVTLRGLRLINITRLEKYTHVLAGLSIFLCAAAMRVFGI